MSPTAEESVTVLLAAAGLTIPDDEKAEFVAASRPSGRRWMPCTRYRCRTKRNRS